MSVEIIYQVEQCDNLDRELYGLYKTLKGAMNSVSGSEWVLHTFGDKGYHYWSYQEKYGKYYEIEEIPLHD